MTSPSTSLNPPSVRPPAWNLPNLVLWGLYALAVLMLALLFTIGSLNDRPTIIATYILYVCCIAGAAGIVAISTRRLPPSRLRSAALWFFVSLVAVCLRVTIRLLVLALDIDPTMPLIWWVSQGVFIVMNVSAFLAAAVFLPFQVTAIISMVRLVLGSIMIGYAATLITLSIPFLASLLSPTATWSAGITLPGHTLALGFAFCAVGVRYWQRGGPLVVLTIFSLLCLIISNLVSFFTLLYAPDQEVLRFLVNPLFAIQPVLVAHGIYRSIERPPQFTPPATGQPNNDWLFWSMLPRASAAVALLVAIASGQVLLPLLLVLGVVWLGHELVTFVDARRVQKSLELAYIREREASELIRFFSHELKGFAAELVGLTQLLRRQIDIEPATPDRSEQLTTLDLLDGALIDIQDLLQQVLLLAEEGELAPRPREPVALAPLLNEIRSSFIPGFQLDPAVLRVSAPSDLIVPGDPLFLGLAVRGHPQCAGVPAQ